MSKHLSKMLTLAELLASTLSLTRNILAPFYYMLSFLTSSVSWISVMNTTSVFTRMLSRDGTEVATAITNFFFSRRRIYFVTSVKQIQTNTTLVPVATWFKNLKEFPIWKIEIVGEWEGVCSIKISSPKVVERHLALSRATHPNYHYNDKDHLHHLSLSPYYYLPHIC